MKKSKKLAIIVIAVFLMSIVFSTIFTAHAAVNDGLLLHYDFTDGVKDLSGKNHNGTLQGGATIIDSDVGKAASFNGETSYIDCSSVSLTNMTQLTFALWIKSEPSPGEFISILSCNGWANAGDTVFLLRNGIYYQFSSNGTPDIVYEGYEMQLSVWEHVAYTCDVVSGKTQVYINGVLKDEFESEWISELYLDGFAIGAWTFDGDEYQRFYAGQMADIRIYDRILTLDELAQLSAIGGGDNNDSDSAAESSDVEESTVAEIETPESAPAAPLTSNFSVFLTLICVFFCFVSAVFLSTRLVRQINGKTH